MATGIEWTDETWNCVRGCSVVSPGCVRCYAKRQAHRFSGPGGPYEGLTKMTNHGPEWSGVVRLVPELLDQPLRWKKPRRIFVNSMSDLFHEGLDDGAIDHIFGIMALAPRHIFQILTKRPARMRDYIHAVASDHGAERVWQLAWERQPSCDGWDTRPWPLPNVWLGVSVENQATADERIPLLLQTPAAVRFLSCEPMLGPVNAERALWPRCEHCDEIKVGFDGLWSCRRPGCRGRDPHVDSRVDWVIVGGESGAGARPMHPDWARELRDQCQEAGVPYFFKQHGDWAPFYDRDRDDPDWRNVPRESACVTYRNLQGGIGFHGERVVFFVRVGKKAAGRLLDGVEWSQFPEGVR